MSEAQNLPQVNYSQLEADRERSTQQDLRRKLKAVSENDIGRIGTLRHSVLGLVVAENYERAREEIRAHVRNQTEFPLFQDRAAKWVDHTCSLVQAIQTKRNFPGLGTLSLSKQQGIHERVLDHFEELKAGLKRLERSERDHRMADVRATAWVVIVFAHCLMAIVTIAFAHQIQNGLAYSMNVIFTALVEDTTRWFEHLFGWA